MIYQSRLVDHLLELPFSRRNNATPRSATPGRRSRAGYAGPADPADRCRRAGARPFHRAGDRAPLGCRAAGGARLAVPRAAPPGGSRLDFVLLGHIGEQPAGAFLPADGGRAAPARPADLALGTTGAGHRARAEPGAGFERGVTHSA